MDEEGAKTRPAQVAEGVACLVNGSSLPPNEEDCLINTRELFTRHNVRCTRQRLALYEALRVCKSHPTADELFNMVAPNLGGMSRATVYNTLEMLCDSGLARKMPTTSGCCRYDADIADHVHLRMRDTAEIRDVPDEFGHRLIESLPRDLLDQIGQAMGVHIDDVHIQLSGRAAKA